MSNKNQSYCKPRESATGLGSITLQFNSTEEEITRKLKQVPFEFTVRIAAAIGNIWQEQK